MRILKTDLKNNRIVLRPETPTDIYVLSNLITVGDRLIAKTSRRIRRIGSEGRTGDDSQRVTMVIGIEVEDHSFQDSSVSNRLRVKGKIFQGPEQYVSIGSYHTLNLELSRVVTIVKTEWSKYYLQLLKEAEEASKKPKICLIAIDKTEVCIGLLDNFNITVIAQEKSGISRKGTKEKIRFKQTQSYFDQIATIISRSILPETKNIVLGGPGFIKEQLATFIRGKFVKDNLNVIVAGSLSGGNRVGLSELLQVEAIDKLANDFRVLEEQHLIEEFFERINQGTSNVSYGLRNLQEVAKTGAIERILLLDSLLRGVEGINFSEVQQLLQEVERTRGKVSIVSAQSENAQKLKTFGGIVALLRYALTWD